MEWELIAQGSVLVGTPNLNGKEAHQRVAYRNFDFTVVVFARVGGMISSALFGAGFTNTAG